MNHDWTLAAACRGMDTKLFFSDDPQVTDLAKRVCQRCPVAWACLDEAIATDQSKAYGVRAGLTGHDRNRMRQPTRQNLPKAQIERLKTASRALIERGLPSQEIAAQLGVDKRTVCRWRNEFKAAA